MKNKKGQFMFYIFFIVIALLMIIIGAFIAPLGVTISTEMYEGGEQILLDNQETINQIENATIRNAIQENIDNAVYATDDNISVLTALFRYSWLIVVILVVLLFMIYARQYSEVGNVF